MSAVVTVAVIVLILAVSAHHGLRKTGRPPLRPVRIRPNPRHRNPHRPSSLTA